MELELPGEMFVKPLEGDENLFAFRWDFVPQGKALDEGGTEQVVTELPDGDLLIRGYAAVWEGDDREGENFEPGAFDRGIKSFLGSQAALCFHHKADHGIGRVRELEQDGKGLRM
jgi:Caudovirus prohead serine protease